MSHINWDSLRNIAGLTLDDIEHQQHMKQGAADRQADLRARGIIK